MSKIDKMITKKTVSNPEC